MVDGQGPEKYAQAPGAFWKRCEIAASSRKAMQLRFQQAGHRVSIQSIGGWVRGEVDPGLPVTLWASELFGVSIDELKEGEAVDGFVAEQLRRQAAELDRQGRRTTHLYELIDEIAERGRWPDLLQKRAGEESVDVREAQGA